MKKAILREKLRKKNYIEDPIAGEVKIKRKPKKEKSDK